MPRHTLRAAGFTLVELAIVLLIVGVMIAGILKGRELYHNAQIGKFLRDQKAIVSAFHTYQDRYDALAGDDPRSLARYPDCGTIGLCGNGNGDGLIQEATESPLVVLIAAGMLQHGDIAAPKGQRNSMASRDLNNVFWNVHTPVNISLFGQNNRVWLNAIDGQDDGIFTPAEAARIDVKTDDGNGTLGAVLGIHGARGDCTTPSGYESSAAGAGDYRTGETVKSCRPFFLVR